MNFVVVLEGKKFTSLEELGLNMYLYTEASEKLITSDKFLKFLKDYDNEKYSKLVKLNHSVRNYEEFIFLAQYIFNPTMNLRHHTYSFQTFQELGEKILNYAPQIDVYLMDFLKYKLLSKYMEMTNYHLRDQDLYQKIKEIEKVYDINTKKAYFFLGFTLANCDIIYYDGKIYHDVDELFKELTSEYHLAKYASLIDANQYLLSYLSFYGYNNIVDRYQSLTNLIATLEDEYENRRKNSKMEK